MRQRPWPFLVFLMLVSCIAGAAGGFTVLYLLEFNDPSPAPRLDKPAEFDKARYHGPNIEISDTLTGIRIASPDIEIDPEVLLEELRSTGICYVPQAHNDSSNRLRIALVPAPQKMSFPQSELLDSIGAFSLRFIPTLTPNFDETGDYYRFNCPPGYTLDLIIWVHSPKHSLRDLAQLLAREVKGHFPRIYDRKSIFGKPDPEPQKKSRSGEQFASHLHSIPP